MPFDELWYFDVAKYSGADETTKAVIARTLAKLPEDVAEWAVEACVFASVGGVTWGHALTLSDWNRLSSPLHVIVLDEVVMASSNGSYVVAHEIAHIRLGHAAFPKLGEETEAAADRLAATWGFERA
jgi:hypothetical protein